jgi:hypothetical protein
VPSINVSGAALRSTRALDPVITQPTSAMTADEVSDAYEWVSLSRTYESFPLYLRFPRGLDYDLMQKKYPRRLIITHTFAFRRFDGAPEPKYNDTLEDFDLSVTRRFDGTEMGQPVLVETFGGKRHYYFYVAPSVDAEAFVRELTDRYPGHKLTMRCDDDPNWQFIRRYSEEYLDGV